jgi:hypothetical protein
VLSDVIIFSPGIVKSKVCSCGHLTPVIAISAAQVRGCNADLFCMAAARANQISGGYEKFSLG